MKEKIVFPFNGLTFKNMNKIVNNDYDINELTKNTKAYLDCIKFLSIMLKYYNSFIYKTKSNIKPEEYMNYIIFTIHITFINNNYDENIDSFDEAIKTFSNFADFQHFRINQKERQSLKESITKLFNNISYINTNKLSKKLIKKLKNGN